MNKQQLLPYIFAYLAEKPSFFALIRPQEAFLFRKYKNFIQSPTLDFGCGDGFFAQLAFPNGIHTGLDVYKSRAHEAKKRHIYRSILLYTGKYIPVPDHSYQTIVSNCVFEHLPAIQQSIEEIYRILKPGGYCITSVMTNQWDTHLAGSRLLGKTYVDWMHRKQIHINLFSLTQWKNIFTKQGFIIEDIVGYISPKNAAALDIAHYVSIPSLILHTITGKWSFVPWGWLRKWIANRILTYIEMPVPPEKSCALFFILKKL